MLKKVLIQCMFGSPHKWIQPYLDHFARLEEFGWYMKIFTPNELQAPANIEVIPMTVEEYDALMFQKVGVKADNHLWQGVPAKLISDHYVAFGQIFEDYIRDFDFWGHTNFDVVYGRLDHFLTDSMLDECDIWSDDFNAINGVFCVYRNNPTVNNLFREIPQWEECFVQHVPAAVDEVRMTLTVRQLVQDGKVRFGYPKYFSWMSYDRLIQHQPKPNVYLESDGALIERFEDQVHFPNENGWFGRELFAFHFSRTKEWPLSA